MDYFSQANSAPLYILVGVVLLFVAISCVLFIRKSYLAGLKMGMDRNVLRTTITASALFTVLPSISILLGVIALSGSLGCPPPGFAFRSWATSPMKRSPQKPLLRRWAFP